MGRPAKADHGIWAPLRAGLHHDVGHVFAGGAVALLVLHVRQRHLRRRAPQTLRRVPLGHARRLGHGVGVVGGRRVVHGPVHHDVVGGAGGDGAGRQDHRTRDLADALETAQPPRPGAELLHEPVRRHDVDPVDQAQPGAGREDRTGREPVDLVDREPGVGHGGEARLEREGTEGDVGAPLERALGRADDGDLAAGLEAGAHDANLKTGTATPSATSSNSTVTGAPIAIDSGAGPAMRPMTRTAASSSSISATV